jgi:ribosomal protein S18 acetylase RimI-like enzyme
MEMTKDLAVFRTALESVKKDSDNEIFETPEWFQVITPGAPTPFMNSILRSLLTEENADSRIERAIEDYRARQLPFMWVVSPWSRPLSLGKKLLHHGLQLRDVTAGLSASATDLAKIASSDVQVEQLTQENTEDWIKANIAAWEIPPQGHPVVKSRAEKALRSSDSFYFLARFQGEPAAVGNLRLFNGFSFLTSGAVKKQLRGCGIYRALVAHRARFSLERGVDLVITHAVANTSAPILEKLGFKKHCEMKHYFYDQKSSF